ncbi:MAG: hypothetical protein WBA46_16255 [Thermomicrobiales bacterium]
MMHMITSPAFTQYSQERLGSKIPRRIEEPEDRVPSWAELPATQSATPRVLRAFSFSFDGVRRLFGGAPKVRHS